MPIDPSMLAKSIGTLTDLHPDQDLPATLQQAVIAAKQLFEADAAGVMLVDLDGALERRWGEIALVFVEVHIRSGLSVPVDLGGGPIGTLDVYVAAPRGWDDSEVTALQAYAGVVASLLSAAAKAHLRGALADQLRTALDSRGLIERAKGALMERERRTTRRPSPTCAGRPGPHGPQADRGAAEIAAGQPLPQWRTRPARAKPEQPDGDAGAVQAGTCGGVAAEDGRRRWPPAGPALRV